MLATRVGLPGAISLFWHSRAATRDHLYHRPGIMHQRICEHGTLRGLCTPGRHSSCGRIARGGGGVFALAQPLKTKPTIARPAQPRPQVQGAGDVPPLVARMLSSPDLEVPEGSDMLQLLKVTEAYWKV